MNAKQSLKHFASKHKNTIVNIKEKAIIFIFFPLFCFLIARAGAYFGFKFYWGIVLYMVAFFLAPYIVFVALIVYVTMQTLLWAIEEKFSKALLGGILLVGFSIFLILSGALSLGLDYVKDYPSQTIDLSEKLSCDNNYCHGKCYSTCLKGMRFVCGEQEGWCEYDPNKCEDIGLHRCKDTCWEICPKGTYFVCDDVEGGICLPY